jgi:hypothetical protein
VALGVSCADRITGLHQGLAMETLMFENVGHKNTPPFDVRRLNRIICYVLVEIALFVALIIVLLNMTGGR